MRNPEVSRQPCGHGRFAGPRVAHDHDAMYHRRVTRTPDLVECVRVFDRSDCHNRLVSTPIGKRTQRRHGGQSTDRSAAGGSQLLREHLTAIAFTKHTRPKGPGASALPRPAAERSVLCPLCPRCVRFFMSVETSYAPSPTHRCLGLDRCERRCRPRPVQSIISDAIH